MLSQSNFVLVVMMILVVVGTTHLSSALEWDDHGSLAFDRSPHPTQSGFRTFDAKELFSENSADTAQTFSRQHQLIDEAREFFQQEGYLVLDNVLNSAEVDEAVHQHFPNFMRHSFGIDVTSLESLRRHPEPQGIVSQRGAGQSALNWLVRSRPNVKEAFRLLYNLSSVGTNDGPQTKLITSFDGINVLRNPEADASWESATESWFHVDAVTQEEGQRYVQGLVNLLDATYPSEAGLVILPRSHRTLFNHMVPLPSAPKDQFSGGLTYLDDYLEDGGKINDIAELDDEKGEVRAFRVPLKAGSMALWNSSVLHCNTGCLRREHGTDTGRSANASQLIRRLVSYVAMLPDPKSPQLSAQRWVAFKGGLTGGHRADVIRWASHTREVPETAAVAEGAVIVEEKNLPSGAFELL